MPPCKTSPAPTPLQLSLRRQQALPSWLSSVQRLNESSRIAASQNLGEITAAIGTTQAAFRSLELEGEVNAKMTAGEAMQILRAHFPGTHAAVARLLANVHRLLGREEFMIIFERETGPVQEFD